MFVCGLAANERLSIVTKRHLPENLALFLTAGGGWVGQLSSAAAALAADAGRRRVQIAAVVRQRSPAE